jgi:glutamyl-Q tRNA(Asp) synthetase
MRSRFAPSPTGPLHLGHAYSALLAHDMARSAGGAFLLRIEDIDQSRARASWETQIYDDLHWLGLRWDGDVLRQSDQMARYQAALDRLWEMGLLYPCACSRKDINAALSAPQEGTQPPGAPLHGPDGLIYPGTCRPGGPDGPGGPGGPGADPNSRTKRPTGTTLRLDMKRATKVTGTSATTGTHSFTESGHGPSGASGAITTTAQHYHDGVGDIVLARRDMGTSYHLSVVLDDAAQDISHVVRGQDLFDATRIHVLLQTLLDLPTPLYHHHRLIRDENGKRLAKRDDARAIAKYRAEGASPQDIRQMVGL